MVRRPDLYFFDKHAADFSEWFFEPADWILKRNGLGFSFETPLKRQFDILPWQPKQQAWREIKQFDKIERRFEVSKNDLREILDWKQKRRIQFGRKPSFPKFFRMVAEDSQMFLQLGKGAENRKQLGILPAKTEEIDPIGNLTIEVNHINRIAKLAIEYELGFEAVILKIDGAPMAIQFTSIDFWCPLKITLPLTVSKYGAPTEICEFI